MVMESMPTPEAARAFDQLARLYDETREVPEEKVLDRLSDHLHGLGIQTILEVGVGTGRIAAPLSRQGFEIVGVDASKEMIRRARSRGLARVVLGDAHQLPFADGCVDAALFVHVLHLLESPREALKEACRAGRQGALALVEPASGKREDAIEHSEPNPRTLVFDSLRRMGYAVPAAAGTPNAREREILSLLPPDRLYLLDEQDVTEPLARELEFLRKGASRWTLHIPRDALERAVAEAQDRVGTRTQTYHRVQALALWEPRVR
jgi:ubiquinone/menaquinone biosynthesis C-methylase UbiE